MIRIIKYLFSSVASFGVDIGLFTLINMALSGTAIDPKIRLFLATALARAISSFVNYTMNRKVVFDSKENVKKSIVRYYILCVCQMFASYALVYVFGELIFKLGGGALETVVKFGVDSFLFIISYNIQRVWVFKK